MISEMIDLLKADKKEERYVWKSLLFCSNGDEKMKPSFVL